MVGEPAGPALCGGQSFVLDCGSAPLSMVTNSRQLFFPAATPRTRTRKDKSISTRSKGVGERNRDGPNDDAES